MTKLTITINMDNAAFFDPETNAHDWNEEAARLVRELSRSIYASSPKE